MYCKKHKHMIRCNSLQKSICSNCNEEFVTSNAPPLDSLCDECSEKLHKCAFCTEDVTE